MRVSVIVPLFNKERTIRRCLDSIAAQTARDFEVIVVDDGSTDSGPALVSGYPDARFRLLRQPNAGPGAARNRGLEQARAPLVAFLDADDAWRPEYLETNLGLLEAAAQNVASITCASLDFPDRRWNEAFWKKRGVSEGVHRVGPATPAVILMAMLAYMTPCATVARAGALRRWGGFYERGCRYGEDAMLWLKVLLNETVMFHFTPLVEVYRQDSSLSLNLAGARPVEPFLSDPGEVRAVCPAPLRGLLEEFYAVRALKTASVLGYWGEWRQAREIFSRFVSWRHWRAPCFLTALAGCTPLGGWAGSAWRAAASLFAPNRRRRGRREE
jgi:hypothetical protein